MHIRLTLLYQWWCPPWCKKWTKKWLRFAIRINSITWNGRYTIPLSLYNSSLPIQLLGVIVWFCKYFINNAGSKKYSLLITWSYRGYLTHTNHFWNTCNSHHLLTNLDCSFGLNLIRSLLMPFHVYCRMVEKRHIRSKSSTMVDSDTSNV